MSQSEKAQLYALIKDAGVPMTQHYRNYTTEELREAAGKLWPEGLPKQQTQANPRDPLPGQEPFEFEEEEPAPATYGGMRAYSKTDEEPIRVDPVTGFVWFRDEVRKPAYPRPRARRKLQYVDSGSKKVQSTENGRLVESFEVAGDEHQLNEVKITLPSYQVGVYLDKRFPFKIHIYNDVKGFDLFDVQEFYGGADLVPADVKRIYVSNDLCYDMRSTIRAIEAEARHLEEKGFLR